MGLQIRQKLSLLGPLLAIDAPSPTGSQTLSRADVQRLLDPSRLDCPHVFAPMPWSDASNHQAAANGGFRNIAA